MTFISRVSSGARPEWMDKRRSVDRAAPQVIMPLDNINPDGSSSLHDQLMAAFRASRHAWLGDEGGHEEEETEEILHSASRLALELAMLNREEKWRLLKENWLDEVA